MIETIIQWVKENFFRQVFYLTRSKVKKEPPRNAKIYWGMWTSFALLFSISTYIMLAVSTIPVWMLPTFLLLLSMFFVGESAGVGLKFPFIFHGWGSTYSEWNWWYIKNGLIRAIWGYNLSIMVMVHLSVILGSLLAIWLTLHFAMRGREN